MANNGLWFIFYFIFIKYVYGENVFKKMGNTKIIWKKYLIIIFCLLLQLKMKDLIITTTV